MKHHRIGVNVVRLAAGALAAAVAIGGCAAGEHDRVEAAGAQASPGVEQPTAWGIAASALPSGFDPAAKGPERTLPGDSITEPTVASTYETDAGRLTIVTGSHDALEMVTGGGEQTPFEASGLQGRYETFGGLTVVVILDDDGLHISAVALAHDTSPDAVIPAAASALSGQAGEPVEQGDLSPYTGAAPSNDVTYSGPQVALVVRTFDQELDSILDEVAPLAQPVEGVGRPAYGIDVNGSIALVTTAADGRLVQIVATARVLTMAQLAQLARSLEGR